MCCLYYVPKLHKFVCAEKLVIKCDQLNYYILIQFFDSEEKILTVNFALRKNAFVFLSSHHFFPDVQQFLNIHKWQKRM